MFILDQGGREPLYKQLYNQIRADVLSGKLPAHARLPSVRDLATELSTSRNTVDSAYQELSAEGYIYSRERSGYFVSAIDRLAASQPLDRGNRRSRPRQPATGFTYDFHPARLDPAGFPTAAWRTCFLETLRESSLEFSHYGDPQGDWGLRSNIQQYLGRSRGVICEPDQIIICSGLQQSLDLVAHLLQDTHSTLAVEDPGYHLPRAVFRNNRFNIAPVPVGANGIDLDALKASGGTIAYVTPSHQLPMGHVMPIANRLGLIGWSEKGNLIIEDDYDSELRYHGKPIPSLQGLRPDGNIIYNGTFSKVLSPALRLSYLVLPPSLLPRFRELYSDYFSTVSLLEQKTMARFMELGYWERHVRRMRIGYQKKHDAMLRAIDRHFGDRACVVGQGAGLHVVMQLRDDKIGETGIISRAAEHGINLFPFSATCISAAPGATSLLLGFGGMTVAEIEQGIEQLSGILP